MTRKRLATLRAIAGIIFKVTLVLAAALAVWCWQVVRVPEGHAAVIFDRTRGTRHDRTLAAGWHLMWTWDRAFPYQLHPDQFRAEVDALTSQGATIKLAYTATLRPDPAQLSHLHQEVGPNYVQVLGLPSINATVREFVGHASWPGANRQTLDDLAASVMARLAQSQLADGRGYVIFESIAFTMVGGSGRGQ